jgi:hypothetical protein
LVSSVLWFTMALAFVIGIPGLVGTGIASSPLYQQAWFQEAFVGGLFAWLDSFLWAEVAKPAWGIAVTLLFVLAVLLAGVVVWLTYRLLDSAAWTARLLGALVFAEALALGTATWAGLSEQAVLPVAIGTLLGAMVVLMVGVVNRSAAVAVHLSVVSLLIVGVAACLLWTLIADRNFRMVAIGWILIFLAALAVQRIGVWRWSSWDQQERIEARSRWRDGTRRRPLGRWFDISVLALLAISLLAAAASLAIGPVNSSWALFILASLGIFALAIALGAAQDAINGRALGSAPGEGAP